jgi:hypothetical protein
MFPGSTFHPLEGGKGFLDILLEVLNENDRLSFQQMIESIFGSVDFQKSIDDEDDENDSGENPQIDKRETSFCLMLLFEQNAPPSLFLSESLRSHGASSIHHLSKSGEFLFRTPILELFQSEEVSHLDEIFDGLLLLFRLEFGDFKIFNSNGLYFYGWID